MEQEVAKQKVVQPSRKLALSAHVIHPETRNITRNCTICITMWKRVPRTQKISVEWKLYVSNSSTNRIYENVGHSLSCMKPAVCNISYKLIVTKNFWCVRSTCNGYESGLILNEISLQFCTDLTVLSKLGNSRRFCMHDRVWPCSGVVSSIVNTFEPQYFWKTP